jgi:hypothetical protein
MSKAMLKSRYESIPKRNFRNAIIKLCEEHYKILGSRKVLQMLADDIEELHQEFYPEAVNRGMGYIVWRTTDASSKKPSYGQRAEDYKVKTVLLPLITEADIEARLVGRQAKSGNQFIPQQERDIQVMARLIKSAYEQGGILSGAELSVLLNRSLTAIGRYLKLYHQQHKAEILPTKGNILDQGSSPTHKGVIIDLYEQGYPEIDIARLTTHNIESVGRYIKTYKDVILMLEKELSLMEMVRVTGRGRSTILQYRELAYSYHPELKKISSEEKDKKEESDDVKSLKAP